MQINGEESFTIDYEKLSAPKEVSSVPFGERIKINAEVTERATGTKEVAIDKSVQIVETPFTISFGKTMKYFKPGIVFGVGVFCDFYTLYKSFIAFIDKSLQGSRFLIFHLFTFGLMYNFFKVFILFR